MITHSDRIQLHTLTKWCNKYLATVEEHVDDLFIDFHDGLKLIALVQVLSKKKITEKKKRPQSIIHCYDNVSLVLQFLKNTEGIKLVNIGKSNLSSNQKVNERSKKD